MTTLHHAKANNVLITQAIAKEYIQASYSPTIHNVEEGAALQVCSHHHTHLRGGGRIKSTHSTQINKKSVIVLIEITSRKGYTAAVNDATAQSADETWLKG